VLETNEPLLLRIRPGVEADQDPVGTLTVSNPCLSGGELEIFLEPRLPPARIRVMGESPIAEAMLRLGDSLGYDVQRGGEIDTDDTAVIVASHGQGDEETSVAAALRAGVPYVGLVASPATLQWLRDDGFSPVELERLHVPAGLDIGSRTHSEIALSIYAQLVSLRIEVVAAERHDSSDPRGSTGVAVDPVCGMIEPAGGAWERIEHDGREFAFCCSGCRGAFQAAPERYAVER
jgi:xanthine dehydrogenase accessory factor